MVIKGIIFLILPKKFRELKNLIFLVAFVKTKNTVAIKNNTLMV
jgi:hypothetical protein